MALWAGIAAVMLLYFGYRTAFLSSTPAERIGASLLTYTLKFGGWSMVLATAWLLTGMRAALLADAVACAGIGLGLLSGGLLYLSPDLNLVGVLYPVVGVVFLGSARTGWREYQLLGGPSAEGATAGADAAREDRHAAASPAVADSAPGSLTGRLIEQRRERKGVPRSVAELSPSESRRSAAVEQVPASVPSPPAPLIPPAPVVPPSAPETAGPPAAPPEQNEDSPEGFLAQFARRENAPGEQG